MNELATRLALTAAAGLCALIVGTIALCFLGQALYLALAVTSVGPAGAAGIVGAVGLVLAGILGLVARQIMHRHKPAAVAPAPLPAANPVNEAIAQVAAVAVQHAAAKVRAHPYGTLGGALAAGLAVGAIPELRKALLGLLPR